MQTFEQHKSEGEALVTEAVAGIKDGSIKAEALDGKMTKALTLYNQAAEHLPDDEQVKAAANAVSSLYYQKALAYKVLLEHASA